MKTSIKTILAAFAAISTMASCQKNLTGSAIHDGLFQLLGSHHNSFGAEIREFAALRDYTIILRNHTGCIIRTFLKLSTKISGKLLLFCWIP